MVNRAWFSKGIQQRRRTLGWTLVKHYRAITTASVDLTWQKVIDLTDLSWHPLIARTNVPYGLVPKPGLIYEAINRLIPLPFRIFVEGVSPQQLLSIRILGVPGVEERVTYQIESSVCGTYISYCVMLRGWLSPFVWSFLQGYAAKVAEQLAAAAEAESLSLVSKRLRSRGNTCLDF
ncbi:MAG: SRPBCC family protein [Thermosynechococcaceae cyanobacterium]